MTTGAEKERMVEPENSRDGWLSATVSDGVGDPLSPGRQTVARLYARQRITCLKYQARRQLCTEQLVFRIYDEFEPVRIALVNGVLIYGPLMNYYYCTKGMSSLNYTFRGIKFLKVQ